MASIGGRRLVTIQGVLSFIAAMRASRVFGKGIRLQEAGGLLEAQEVFRKGLGLLRAPYVKRQRAPEASVLSGLTIYTECNAAAHGLPGVGKQDLLDVIEFLEALPDPSACEYCQYIPFLRSRLQAMGSGVHPALANETTANTS